MQEITAQVDISGGLANLKKLEETVEQLDGNVNESTTRFKLIDELLVSCFGWPKSHIETERYERDDYTDYELGRPRQVLIEAKRIGKVFELPADIRSQEFQNIKSVYALGGDLADAMEQAQGYASRRGIPIAVVTNGLQIIAFLATRDDGSSPLEAGKCLVIKNFSALQSKFPQFWQYFSPDGISQRILLRALQARERPTIPEKLSSYLKQYPRVRYPSQLQANLSQLSEVFIQDLPVSKDIEKSFYEHCYCESGALSQHATLSRQILEARYAALFPRNEESASAIVPARDRKLGDQITPEVLSEAMSSRPLVLVGDVGVGKTSFIKHLKYIAAYEEFRDSIYLYIDLGSKAALTSDLHTFILGEIEQQLEQNYDVDILEEKFIKGAFASEIARFEKGIWGTFKDSDPKKYREKRNEHLARLLRDKSEHLRRSIEHLSKGRHKQIIIAIDNADQREADIQQQAFIISQEFAKYWHATVFLSVRPQTFFKSKQSGALSAYPHKIFSISPPRPEEVVRKRLQFALDLLQGQAMANGLSVGISSENLELFLKAMLESLQKNKDLSEFLSNITGGNIREVIDLVTKFIGSPNVDAEKIIDKIDSGNGYIIPLHEFSKPALLGNYSHFNPDSAIAMNLFDVSSPDRKEHFLTSILISYLSANGPHKDKHGFVETDLIFKELQASAFRPEQIEDILRRSTNKKLIETPQRLTFEEDETKLIGKIPQMFRVTSVGIYHVNRWMPSFAYLDAMAFDTPIFDDETMRWMSKDVESFRIESRLERTKAFRKYLEESWDEAKFAISYFNFSSELRKGDATFRTIENVVRKIRAESESD